MGVEGGGRGVHLPMRTTATFPAPINSKPSWYHCSIWAGSVSMIEALADSGNGSTVAASFASSGCKALVASSYRETLISKGPSFRINLVLSGALLAVILFGTNPLSCSNKAVFSSSFKSS